MSNKTKGKYGEDIAVNYLIKLGYKIIERNYHFSRYGEVDIIALDKDTLCFVEVKARTNDKFGTPLDAVTRTKLAKIHKCALSYLSQAKCAFKNFRIDAVSILFNGENAAKTCDKDLKTGKGSKEAPKITHIKNIEF